jgi:rubrerythrin
MLCVPVLRIGLTEVRTAKGVFSFGLHALKVHDLSRAALPDIFDELRIHRVLARAAGAPARWRIGLTQRRCSVNATTVANLLTAMHGEAFAYAKFMLYAERARQQGHTELAQLFENAAKEERFEHFAEGAGLAGLVRTDADNLREAIEAESYEIETRYHEFAEKALGSGDHAAAAHFEGSRRAEVRRREAFKAALAKVQKDGMRAW